MNRRQFLQCSAALGLTALLPQIGEPATSSTAAGHSINQFAQRLLTVLPSDQNLFVSPFSIAAALALAAGGSGGDTAAEFNKLLGFKSQTDMLDSFSQLLPQLTSSTEYELATANGLFVDDSLTLLKPYQQTMQKRFGARVERVDFAGDPEGSVQRLNDWVAQITRGKIKRMMSPNGALKCVLANAIFFKGTWKEAFSRAATRQEPFFLLNGTTVQVPMMNSSPRHLLYAKSNLLEAVQLPYKGRDLAMNVILPARDKKLETIDPRLSNMKFAAPEVQLSMPKLKLTTSYNLVKPLKGIGLVSPFTGAADFSRMSTSSLKIDSVSHKAFLEVDEKGTEAAAATTVAMTELASVPKPPIQFRADRPFLLTIEHLPSKTLLFVGRVLNPTG